MKTAAITKIIDGLQDRPALAGHAFTAARTFFHWAVRRRLLPHSPMEGLQMPRKPVSRDRVLTDTELAAVWALTPELGTFGTILRLLILTGQRCNQIASLRAEHIDHADRVITWPPVLMKGNRQHSIPFGEAVAEILEPLPKAGLLFAARGKETPYNGFSKGTRALRAALEDDQGADAEPFAHFTLHDLRRTMATGMARFGIAPHVVERILDHRTGTISGVAAIYNRFQYIEEMRAALAVWEIHIAGLQTA